MARFSWCLIAALFLVVAALVVHYVATLDILTGRYVMGGYAVLCGVMVGMCGIMAAFIEDGES